MSVEVKLTDEDFHQIKNWFCLAFAKKSPEDIDCNDLQLNTKLTVMWEAYRIDQTEKHDHDSFGVK